MNIYVITLHEVTGFKLHMPYYYTSLKKACLYGEYKFRTSPRILSYKVEKLVRTWPFYILK